MKKYLISQELLNELWDSIEDNKKFCDLQFRIPFEKLDSKKYESILIWHQCQLDLLRTLYSIETWLNQVEEWRTENNSYPSTFNDPQQIVLELKEIRERIEPIADLFNKWIIPEVGLLNQLYALIRDCRNTPYLLNYKLDEE